MGPPQKHREKEPWAQVPADTANQQLRWEEKAHSQRERGFPAAVSVSERLMFPKSCDVKFPLLTTETRQILKGRKGGRKGGREGRKQSRKGGRERQLETLGGKGLLKKIRVQM